MTRLRMLDRRRPRQGEGGEIAEGAHFGALHFGEMTRFAEIREKNGSIIQVGSNVRHKEGRVSESGFGKNSLKLRPNRQVTVQFGSIADLARFDKNTIQRGFVHLRCIEVLLKTIKHF